MRVTDLKLCLWRGSVLNKNLWRAFCELVIEILEPSQVSAELRFQLQAIVLPTEYKLAEASSPNSELQSAS